MILQIDIYQDAQRYAEARQILQQSLAEVLDNALLIYQPELLRLRGELALAEAPQQSAGAEHWLLQAIEVSRRQQALTLELRATLSLSRLWQTQGKAGQAHQAIKTLYDRFSEGFDTADLRNARTLLAGQ
jgi:predicted ATPase